MILCVSRFISHVLMIYLGNYALILKQSTNSLRSILLNNVNTCQVYVLDPTQTNSGDAAALRGLPLIC